MRAALIALMLMIDSPAGAEDVLYCSSNANLATGFSKQDGQWRTYKFPDRRFSAQKIGNFSSVKINDDMFSCQRPSKDFEPYSITCHNKYGYVFNYYQVTQKFIFVSCSVFSYIHPKFDDTCVIYGGSCEDF